MQRTDVQYTDEQLQNFSDERIDLLRRCGDLDQYWRACRMKDDPEGYAQDKRKQELRDREKELELLQREKEAERRINALKAPPPAPQPAPPVRGFHTKRYRSKRPSDIAQSIS